MGAANFGRSRLLAGDSAATEEFSESFDSEPMLVPTGKPDVTKPVMTCYDRQNPFHEVRVAS